MAQVSEEAVIGCIGMAVLGAVLLLCPIGCYGCSRIQMSEGYRDSTVRKMSETGIVWKTWEVEALGDGLRLADGRATPETFKYTVSDPNVVEHLRTLPPGKRVRLYYRKMAGTWSPAGETPYFITRVEDLPPDAK